MFLVGKTKKNDAPKEDINKTSFELKSFKYSEMNASGLSLIILGSSGYYFENGNAKIEPFTMYRLDSNITEQLNAKNAKRVIPNFFLEGNITYTRSDGVILRAEQAVYDEQNKTLFAKPAYVQIRINE
ncbi:MAG: hypothetical protein RL154_883 [Pseudomonadota bacterium]